MSKSSPAPLESASALSEQAAHWWAILHGEDCTQTDRREFAAWVAQAPDRVKAYLHVASAMHALTRPDTPWPATPVDELIREARATRNIEQLAVPREDFPERPRLPRAAPWFAGMAALVVLAVVVILLTDSPQRYRTGVGEQISVRLSDGSLLKINTRSDVEVRFDASHRSVELISGEALFQVAHDPDRPFDVAAGPAQIRAVGTEFNVDRRDSSTTITVLEGRVIVSQPPMDEEGFLDGSPDLEAEVPLTLAAADRLVVADSGPASIDRVSDLAIVTAWTEQRLVFQSRPLGEVADEFNRYNRDQIRIEDPVLRRQEVTGLFQADDPQSFLAFMAEIPGVTIRAGDGVHTVTRK